ncbi:hypothetical protein BKA00_001123 [Actinomadura coerulea]|uniref:Uncharacterized protein n=1 Tax=Actinomadura coerulea TaxID=46159 RepID=A0A7X0FV09_9ACTN|nr:hypothetical protein [Actinomadura coerulea]MBB6394209.1 hypothetical protein [Actinomadura coerulea]GGQ20977.1 hypothetical protein GCM10010187_41780 [Actinomadura coerulea]
MTAATRTPFDPRVHALTEDGDILQDFLIPQARAFQRWNRKLTCDKASGQNRLSSGRGARHNRRGHRRRAAISLRGDRIHGL